MRARVAAALERWFGDRHRGDDGYAPPTVSVDDLEAVAARERDRARKETEREILASIKATGWWWPR